MSVRVSTNRVPEYAPRPRVKALKIIFLVFAVGCIGLAIADFANKRWGGGPKVTGTNWQYAKWGMSPDQLREASKGSVSNVTGEGRYSAKGDKALLEASYQSGPYDFTVAFMFDPQSRLSAIELQLTDTSKCKDLLFSLSSRYGEGTETGRPLNMTMWSDEAHGNDVTYFDEIIACRVLYSPVDEPGISGNPNEPGGL